MPEDRLYVGPIYVKKSLVHGYGVFAAQDLAANEVIEECYSLVYSSENNPLRNYTFDWQEQSAIPLGFGCIYNHSDTPNISCDFYHDQNLIIFKTLRTISKGDELLFSYGKHWFESRRLTIKSSNRWRHAYRNGGRLALRASLIISGIYACIYGLKYLSF